MKKLLASAMLVCATQMWGADFNENFCDSTLPLTISSEVGQAE